MAEVCNDQRGSLLSVQFNTRMRLTPLWLQIPRSPSLSPHCPLTMIPATREQQEGFESTTSFAPYNLPITDDKNKLVLFELDEIPQPDAQGRVKGEGFKASWTAIVDPGGSEPPGPS